MPFSPVEFRSKMSRSGECEVYRPINFELSMKTSASSVGKHESVTSSGYIARLEVYSHPAPVAIDYLYANSGSGSGQDGQVGR